MQSQNAIQEENSENRKRKRRMNLMKIKKETGSGYFKIRLSRK